MREGTFGNVGAGLYGVPAPTHKTACTNSNNPNGHNPACPKCKPVTFASQQVPYAEPTYPPSRHDALFEGD